MRMEIKITFDGATGEFQITGNLDNEMIAFGMLELAKIQIHQRALDTQKRVQLANGLPPTMQ